MGSGRLRQAVWLAVVCCGSLSGTLAADPGPQVATSSVVDQGQDESWSSLAGHVQDARGQAVEGAQVTVTESLEAPAYRPKPYLAVADQEGRFVVPKLLPGSYCVEVTHDDWCGVHRDSVTVEPGTAKNKVAATKELSFTLSTGQTLQGIVTTVLNGQTIPAAAVTVMARQLRRTEPATEDIPHRPLASAVTDEQGRFELQRLADGATYRLVARRQRWETQEETEVTLTPQTLSEPVALSLAVEGHLQGTVRDGSGQPIRGARIQVVGDETTPGQPRWYSPGEWYLPIDGTSDDDGRFRVNGLDRTKAYHLLITASGFAPVICEARSATDGKSATYTMTPGVTLTGTIRHATNGTPVDGFEVTVTPQRGQGCHDLRWSAQSNADGTFVVRHLPDVSCILHSTPSAESSLVMFPRPLTIRPETDVDVQLEAVAAVTVQGQVVDGRNQPLSGAEVRITTDEVTRHLGWEQLPRVLSDDQGRFMLEGLVPGRLHVSTQLKGYASRVQDIVYSASYGSGQAFLADVKAGDTLQDVRLTMYRKTANDVSTTTGVVLDEEGQPARGIRVYLYRVSGRFDDTLQHAVGQSTTTDDEGRFTFTQQRQDHIGVVVIPTDKQPVYGTSSITWTKPGSPVRSSTVKLERCGSVEGTVVDDVGQPVQGARLRLGSGDRFLIYSRFIPWSVKTDAAGHFRLPFVRPGTHVLELGATGYVRPVSHSHHLVIRAGEVTTLDRGAVVLNRRHQFNGRLVDQYRRPLQGWKAGRGLTSASGRFEYSLRPGENEVKFQTRKSARKFSINIGFISGAISFPEEQPDALQEFQVSTGGTISGVLDVRELKSLSGPVTVTLSTDWDFHRQKPERFQDTRVGWVDATLSDIQSDGAFEFTDLPVGHFRLTFSGPDIVTSTVLAAVDDSLKTDLGLVTIPAGRVVTGRLVARENPEAIPGSAWNIDVDGQRREPDLMPEPGVELDQQGRFRVTGLPVDTTRLSLIVTQKPKHSSSHSGFVSYPLPVVTKQVGHIESLDLSADLRTEVGDVQCGTCRITGRLLNGETGQPMVASDLEQITVTMTSPAFRNEYHKQQLNFDEDGRFSIDHARADFEQVLFEERGFVPLIVEGLETSSTDEVVDLGDIVLDRGLTLSGVVRRPDGRIVDHAQVHVQHLGRKLIANTDGEGRFEISGLTAGRLKIRASAGYYKDRRTGREWNTWIQPNAQDGQRNIILFREDVDMQAGADQEITLSFSAAPKR